jgi:[ribosomal protein S18]-alanine N-acetyltransferase
MNTESKQEIRVHVRWMIRRDMTDVLEIENGSFEFAWSEDDFIRCLRQRNCIGMVAEHNNRVVGFMVYELKKSKLHILNFAVSGQFQRLGVGSQMVAKLIGKLSTGRRNRVALEIRETNLPAQLFFRENGFLATQLLKEFYEDSPEDAYLMQYRYREEPATIPIRPANRITRLAG